MNSIFKVCSLFILVTSNDAIRPNPTTSRHLLEDASASEHAPERPESATIAALAAEMHGQTTHIRAQRVAANLHALEEMLAHNYEGEGHNATLELEYKNILEEAEWRVTNLENRVTGGEIHLPVEREVSPEKIKQLEEELAQAQKHAHEVDDMQKLWVKEKEEMDNKLKELIANDPKVSDPIAEIRKKHDEVMMLEHNTAETPEYIIGMPPHQKLYAEHVGRTASTLKEHLGPLMHRGMDAYSDTTHKLEEAVEEVLYHEVPGKDVNHIPHTSFGFKVIHIGVCFVVLILPVISLIVLVFCMRPMLQRFKLVSLTGFISLCHQYAGGLCVLAMLAEIWSGLEPMHLFYALDYHSYIVFNFITAVLFCIYWMVLLIRSVVAQGKAPTTIAVIQLLIVSGIGSEWYIAVFHRAMINLPPYMNVTTYSAYAASFIFLTLLMLISTPSKMEEIKSS